jgi:hypothetical protein
MLHACQVSSPDELTEILRLQKLYLRGQNPETEEEDQGFLTVPHTYEQLLHMHSVEPSVVVMDGDQVAGYALVMTRESQEIVPILIPMFQHFDRLSYEGKPLNDYRFYVMGQVCVQKDYRGGGVFDMLYLKHRELFQNSYSFVITEISTRNHRSLRAHERVGFRSVDVFRDETDEWNVTLWDWKSAESGI